MTAHNIRSLNSGLRPFTGGRKRKYLPWRRTRDPYRVLVSEVMLQQTQVDRVIPFYKKFVKKFPTVRSLAQASLREVLKAWSGLGYNRRAKMLRDAAGMIYHTGRFPRSYAALRTLPGVGDYTAKAVRVFAFNEPEILIETNIRSAFLHHFFQRRYNVSDTQLYRYIDAAFDRKNPRKWYWALMDYGSYLKRTLENPSRRSAHHARQKPFKGSDREIRGALLRAHLSRRRFDNLPFNKKRVGAQLKKLRAEGLIGYQRSKARVASR